MMTKDDLPIENYRKLLDNFPIGVVQVSEDQTLVYTSKIARKLLLLGNDSGVGMPVLNFIPEEYHELFYKQFSDIKNGGYLEEVEYIVNRTDGSRFFAEISTIGQINEKYGFSGLFITIQDITKKKLIEIELKNSEMRFRSIFENANITMTVADKEGNILMCNQAFVDLTGYTKEELLKMNFKDFTHPDDYETDRSYYKRLMSGEIDKYKIEKKYVCKNGKAVWGLLSVSLVRNEAGAPSYSVRMLEDINDRKEAEKALLESERKSKTLVNNLSGLVYRVRNDKNWSAEYISDGCIELTGYKPEDFYGSSKINFWELTYPDDRLPLKNEVNRGLENKTRYQMSYRIVTSEEKIKWVWEQGQGVQAEDGSIVALEGFITDISDKMDSVFALRESEQKYKALVDNIYDALSVRDLKGKIIYANDKFLSLFAISRSDLTAFSRRDFVSEESELLILNEYKRILTKTISRSTVEIPVINKRGENLWVELRIAPVYGTDNTITAFQNIIQDITHRKKYEVALIESENKYRTLFENLIAAFALTEAVYENGEVVDYKYLDVNPAYEQITGIKTEQVIGKTSRELAYIEEGSLLEEIKDVIASGKPKSFEKYLKKLDKYFDFWLFSPSKNRVACFFTDITGRKIAEEQLKTSEQRFRSYFELPLIGIAILSPELNWLDCNNKVLSILGYSKEELKQKSFLDVTYPDDSLNIIEYNDMINNKIDNYTRINKFIRKDGSMVYSEIAAGCIRRPDKSVSFVVMLIEDISEKVFLAEEVEKHRSHLEVLVEERTKELADVNVLLQMEIEKQKEAEIKVLQALKKEKEVSELKSRFISFASHEFRTPLTTIYSSTQLLERYGRGWNEAMYSKQIARIKENIHFLTNIMDDVLIIGRTETGKIKFEPKEINLASFCDRAVNDIRALLLPGHKLVYKHTLKRDTYLLDEKLLKYILLNLLSNAIKYSPDGGKIKFSIKEIKKNIVFTVSDEGIGIPPADQAILFEPFHRGKNTGDISGTGLGMPIVKRSVEMHHGNIAFKSEENKGSSFTITIPLEF